MLQTFFLQVCEKSTETKESEERNAKTKMKPLIRPQKKVRTLKLLN